MILSHVGHLLSSGRKQWTILMGGILAVKRANVQAETSAWGRGIDQLVYQLYGLAEEEGSNHG